MAWEGWGERGGIGYKQDKKGTVFASHMFTLKWVRGVSGDFCSFMAHMFQLSKNVAYSTNCQILLSYLSKIKYP